MHFLFYNVSRENAELMFNVKWKTVVDINPFYCWNIKIDMADLNRTLENKISLLSRSRTFPTFLFNSQILLLGNAFHVSQSSHANIPWNGKTNETSTFKVIDKMFLYPWPQIDNG